MHNLQSATVLVVGAGGIGCEVIKNLVSSGFDSITVVDLDTIEVSNLNRQFLFRKEHVGMSKAEVACQSAKKIKPGCNIRAMHDNITSPTFNVDFFKQFDVVLNALDNRAARSHVNRLCLAANVVLVESGSAGYLGQVTVIKRGVTECYDCQPKPPQKTYPGCTIRNTPSEPVHCIVWAKHLFNQLFGQADPDEDVSPDTSDPDAAGSAGFDALQNSASSSCVKDRVSTRQWAKESNYDPVKLWSKLFVEDIKYLLSMTNLWVDRSPPTPLQWDADVDVSGLDSLPDRNIPSVACCQNLFKICISKLSKEILQSDDELNELIWDKDEPIRLDFVVAAANIRACIFGIPMKSRFDIKSIAGNIIPAIAASNAIIAGLVVMEAIKIVTDRFDQCRTTYLNYKPNYRGRLLVTSPLCKPNPKCYVCSEKHEITVQLNCETFTCKQFRDKILVKELGMIAPDVIDIMKGSILVSSEEDEIDDQLMERSLKEAGVISGSCLQCDDFLQVFNIHIYIQHVDEVADEVETGVNFIVIGEKPKAIEAESNGIKTSQPIPSNNSESSSYSPPRKRIREVSPIPESASTSSKRKRLISDDVTTISSDEDSSDIEAL